MEGGRLFKVHPGWFGQDESGARNRGDAGGPYRRVFYTSNHDAVHYLIVNFLKYAIAHPEIQVFDFWPPDGAVWCECDRCKALGGPSERQLILLNQVKAALAQVRPDMRLECIAYHLCLMPPKAVRVDRSILVDFCPDGQCFEVQIYDPSAQSNAYYMTALKAWRSAFRGDINIYTYYRKYMWRSLPVLIPHYMQKDLQYYLSMPIQGIQCYAEPGDWFTYDLNHYTLGQLDWNPSVNVDTIIRDFCRTRYGRAAREAVHMYGALEDVVRRTCSIPMTSLKTTEELVRAQKALVNASRRLGGAQRTISDPAVKRNIGRLLLTVEYAIRDLDVQKSKAAKSPATEIRKQEEDLAAFLSEHAGEGIFLP